MSRKKMIELGPEKVTSLFYMLNKTPREIAKKEGLNRQAVYKWLERGKVPESWLIKIKATIDLDSLIKEDQRKRTERDDLLKKVIALRTDTEKAAKPSSTLEMKSLFAPPSPKDFTTEELVAELELRGWTVVLQQQKKDMGVD